MKKINRSLTIFYYTMLSISLLITLIGYLLNKHGFIITNTDLRIGIESGLILYVFISIPLSLKSFSKFSKTLAKEVDNTKRLNIYTTYARYRIIAIVIGLYMSILLYYILNISDLIWIAAITIVALIFCRPTEQRILSDLTPIIIDDVIESELSEDHQEEEEEKTNADDNTHNV